MRAIGVLVLVGVAACGGSDDADVTTTATASEAASTTSTSAPTTSEPATTVPATTTTAPTTTAIASTAPPAPAGLVTLDIPGGPDRLAADDRYVYVKLDTGEVHRIDPETNEIVGTVDVDTGLCQGLGVGLGAVWACKEADVARVDFETGTVDPPIAVGKAAVQRTLATGFDRIWVLLGDGGQLTGIDPATNALDEPIDLGVRGTDVAVAADGVWVVSSPDGAIVRVDPTTREVNGRVDGLDRPSALAVGDDAVWAGGAVTTVRIDPATMTVTDTIDIGVGLDGALALDGTSLWIRNVRDFLQHVDTATGAAEQVSVEATHGGDVLVVFGSVWASAYDDAMLVRLPQT